MCAATWEAESRHAVSPPAGSQIIYAFIMMPHTLPQSYVRWIRKQGAKELYVWQGVRVSGVRGARALLWVTTLLQAVCPACCPGSVCVPTDSPLCLV
jgi:hypothetical protein